MIVLSSCTPRPVGSGQTSGNNQHSANENSTVNVSGRVLNVTSPRFELSNGFIAPINRQTEAPSGWIPIASAEDFDRIRLNPSADYILMADINLADISDYQTTLLQGGTVDGNGHTITGVRWLDGGGPPIFQLQDATIKNIAAVLNGGPLISTAERSQIINCNTSGSMSFFEGGRVITEDEWNAYNNLAHQRATGTTITRSPLALVISDSIIRDCYNVATIEDRVGTFTRSVDFSGLVVGAGLSRIENSFNQGSIHVTSTYEYGNVAIYGITKGGAEAIANSYNSGDLSVSGFSESSVNGVVGTIGTTVPGSIVNSFNSGNLSGGRVAGVGNRITGHNIYNAGNIHATYSAFGIAEGIANQMIMTSYNIGQIAGTEISLFGSIVDDRAQHVYFLDNIETATPDGALFATVKRLTEAQMRDQSFFEGFDFDTVWEMGGTEFPFPVFQAIYSW